MLRGARAHSGAPLGLTLSPPFPLSPPSAPHLAAPEASNPGLKGHSLGTAFRASSQARRSETILQEHAVGMSPHTIKLELSDPATL